MDERLRTARRRSTPLAVPPALGFVDAPVAIDAPVAVDAPPQSERPRVTRVRLPRVGRPSRASLVWAGGVAAIVALAGFILRGELIPVQDLNDGTMHWSMVRWAEGVLRQGRLPLDGWYPRLGLGFPQFHHYQSLPHIVTAIVSVIIGTGGTYPVMQWLLLCTLPLSAWLGARLFGLDRAAALWCAALILLPVSATNYGNELGSYLWRGFGMYPQLWGMWLMPICLALTWRAVDQGRRPVLAGAVLGLTALSHAIVGFLAALMVVVWIVLGRPLAARALRAVVVTIATLCVTAWFLVPLALDSNGATYGGFQRGTFWYDSYGARKVLGWLVTGGIFDRGRPPLLTSLVAVGLIVCVARCRRDRLARALVASFVVSLVLFCGTPTFGWFLRFLPGSHNLFFPRFLVGVHLSGVLLAGVGGAWLVRSLRDVLQQRLPSRIAVVGVVVAALVAGVLLVPPWRERDKYAAEGADLIRTQRQADLSVGGDVAQIADRVRQLGDGRVYSGSSSTAKWWPHVGFVPLNAALVNDDVDTFGHQLRVSSLSTAMEVQFDDRVAWEYDLFNIRYMILPSGQRPWIPATFVMQRGPYALWQVPTSGYVGVVDAVDPIVSNLENLGNAMKPFFASDVFARGRYPLLRLPGTPSGKPTTTSYAALDGAPGTVQWQAADTTDGRFRAEVDVRRSSYVVLRQSWHPRWRATVDGHAVTPVPIAPSYVAVPVGPGRHLVAFDYHPWRMEWLLLEGLVGLVALQLGVVWLRSRGVSVPGRARRRRPSRRVSSEPPAP